MKEATRMKIGTTENTVSVTLSRKGFNNSIKDICYYDLNLQEVDELIGLLKLAKFKVQQEV